MDKLTTILNISSKLEVFAKLLIKCYTPVIIYFIEDKAINTYKLNKDFKPKDISKVKITPKLERKYTDIEINEITSKKIKNALLEFTNVIIKKVPDKSLINFYNNINKVKVKKNKIYLIYGFGGHYLFTKNKINVTIFDSIYHELFHMSSTFYDKEKKIAFSGFSQTNFNYKNVFSGQSIGDGINEGYTELLTNRYFEKYNKNTKAYKFEKNIADKLEKIIGQEEMENLYFNANLMGLIEELKQYSREKEILNFITSVDLIKNQTGNIFLFPNQKIKTCINNIYNFLIQSYTAKLQHQYENGIINSNELINQYEQYIESLGTSVRIGGHKYKILDTNKLQENLQSILNINQSFSNKKTK